MERSADRARRHTARSVPRRIDEDTLDHLMEVAQKPETASRRLEALDREWDIDRTIEAEDALTAMRGDFDGLPANEAGDVKRVRAALAAVDK